MNISGRLADNLLGLYSGDNWTDAFLSETLHQLSFEQAQTQTSVSKNTASALAHHIAFWNEIIIMRLSGSYPKIPEANGFDVSLLRSDEDWQQLLSRLKKSFVDLADKIRSIPEAEYDQKIGGGKSTIGKNIFGIIEHDYYHAGQVAMIAKAVAK